ncbi:MAG: MurT ligase domain-containing protein [Eubacteriales bacterium]|nr:MurT ligase domain-containing protein [Eubacteriales bacterium]
MQLRFLAALASSKALIKILRLFGSGGTTLPGKVADFLCPGIVKIVSSGCRIIIVTGTNGKTTTARIISRILTENGIKYVSNKSGANLASGITTTFLETYHLNGKNNPEMAVIESDEAAFRAISNSIKPEILVVTNFFRDQLDRFGELYHTLSEVKEGISNCPDATLVLNADDSLCASLGRNVKNKVLYYGMSCVSADTPGDSFNTDSAFCLYCKTRYIYSGRTYGHLGHFSCPECGYARPDSNITCTGISELSSSGSKITMAVSVPEYITAEAQINLPGLYNIYNALAASACGAALSLPPDNTIKALKNFVNGFGRMETIATDGKTIRVILVKNPTGLNQVINYLITDENRMNIAFLLNDKIADGTDISWIWDAGFEKLKTIQNRIGNIYAGGARAEDMALRIKYADFETPVVSIIKSCDEILDRGILETGPGQCFYILPTYTAMLDIRKLLVSRFKLKDFWK